MAGVLLVTANVGSVFENMEHGLGPWLDAVMEVVREKKPKFVAIHFQEMGGKNYQNCTKEIHKFFGEMTTRFATEDLILAEGFVDSDAALEDQFTALASVYFVHKELDGLQMWDFDANTFTELRATSDLDKCLHVGSNKDHVERRRKEKFPKHFFPDFRWSRKGYLQTRWRVNETVLDLVNIHLFHDSCNIEAQATSPSKFANNRQKTLKHTLEKLMTEGNNPMFMFGDFNFRLDSKQVIDDLNQKGLGSQLCLGVKTFGFPEQEELFKRNFEWARAYDTEPLEFSNMLELPINFHPSYPFDEEDCDKFMGTRCPSWCDRVLFNNASSNIMNAEAVYDLIGSDICMGDHKPVFLFFHIQSASEGKQTLGFVKSPESVATKLLDDIACDRNPVANACAKSLEIAQVYDSISQVSSPKPPRRLFWSLCAPCTGNRNPKEPISTKKRFRKFSKASQSSKSKMICNGKSSQENNKYLEVIPQLETGDTTKCAKEPRFEVLDVSVTAEVDDKNTKKADKRPGRFSNLMKACRCM